MNAYNVIGKGRAGQREVLQELKTKGMRWAIGGKGSQRASGTANTEGGNCEGAASGDEDRGGDWHGDRDKDEDRAKNMGNQGGVVKTGSLDRQALRHELEG